MSIVALAAIREALGPEERAEPAKVPLKGKPYVIYAPDLDHSTVRYTADADGFLEAAPEHVKALMRAGCARLPQAAPAAVI